MNKSNSQGSLLAYLQLVRLPNVFTAVADVAMGFLFVHGSIEPLPQFCCLLVATVALYSAGMVLNDVFDFRQDLDERPDRPLPSGRVSLARARLLGYSLLLIGMAAGGLAGNVAESGPLQWRCGIIAALLAACVLLYDAVLKQTFAGPIAMGACRFSNILLGMSSGPVAESGLLGFETPQLLVAAGIGIYIVGVTWFARSEASQSHRGPLALGILLMAAGTALLASFPFTESEPTRFFIQPLSVWVGLLALLVLSVLLRCLRALLDPQPKRVQLAVKHSILSLIFLDAAVVALVAPRMYAVAVLALYVPAVLLGRWVYST